LASERAGRRLTAILAADVAGYSQLMGTDEARTVRDLKAHQAVLFPMVSEFGGRIIDTAGDGFLAEFASVVNAVECAVAIQKTMAERNAGIDQAHRMQFRIGVNIGDVICDEARIYGDGINVAARLEGIAEPGGICVSEDAYRQTRGKVDARFADIGEQSLKNIVRPVRAYRVVLDGFAMAAPGPQVASKPGRNADIRPLLAVAAIVAIVIGVRVTYPSMWSTEASSPGVPPASAAPPSSFTLTSIGAEEREWLEVNGAETVSVLRKYLERFPDGAHAAEVQRAIRVADDKAWLGAERDDSIAKLAQYIELFPSGVHVAQARQRIADLERAARDGPAVPPGKTSLRTPPQQAKTEPPPVKSANSPEEFNQLGPERAVREASAVPPVNTRPKTPTQQAKKEPPLAEPANSPEEFNRLGRTYALNGDYAGADIRFSQAIRGNSRYAEAFNNRCWTRAVMGRAEDAIADCTEAIRLRADYADAFDSRGLAHLKLGEFDRAIADFNTALRLRPGKASSLYGRGVAELKMKQTSAGNADIAEAQRIDPAIVQQYEQYGVE
jgi:class 3 adenylate cyclase/tetratricopeptide (TPR) repeat protein